MPTSLMDFRSFGTWRLPAPIFVSEGDPEVIVSAVNESGLPNGTYKVDMTTVWIQDADKYFLLDAYLQGVVSTQIAKESAGPGGYPTVAQGSSLVDVTDGTLTVDMGYEFPSQGGVGDGQVVAIIVSWERKTETSILV